MTVDELETIGTIYKIEIHKKADSHSVCTAEILLEDERKLFRLQNLSGKEVVVEDDDQIYMRGTVKKISSSITCLKSSATVTIVSFSEKADQDARRRIFQNTEKIYSDIINVLNTQEAKYQITDEELSCVQVPEVLIQDGKTDFAFAVMLAAAKGDKVFVNDTDSVCVMNIGKMVEEKIHFIKKEDIIYCDYEFTEETEAVELCLRYYIELGVQVFLYFCLYVVVKTDVFFADDRTVYTCRLLKKLKEKEIPINNGCCMAGLAKVTRTDDPDHFGRLQVEFLEYEDSLPENKVWVSYIPMLTEKDRGVVFLPEAGEVVHVFIENGTCFADGCVRKVQLYEDQQQVQERTIFVRNKRIVLKEDKIEIRGFDYDICLEEERFFVSNQKNRLQVGKDEFLAECCNMKIYANSNEIHLSAKENVKITAKKIRLDAKIGIEAKTETFRVG